MKKKTIDIIEMVKNRLVGEPQQNGKGDGVKYYGFPQEIIYAHLRNYGLKFTSDNMLSISPETQGKICFVKLYLLEKSIIAPLNL